MFRVIDLNDTGKTKKLLKECSLKDGVFVCNHPERVQEKCISYGIPYVKGIGYSEYLNNKDLYKIVYIDELEKLLSVLSNNSISGYSITVDEGDIR